MHFAARSEMSKTSKTNWDCFGFGGFVQTTLEHRMQCLVTVLTMVGSTAGIGMRPEALSLITLAWSIASVCFKMPDLTRDTEWYGMKTGCSSDLKHCLQWFELLQTSSSYWHETLRAIAWAQLTSAWSLHNLWRSLHCISALFVLVISTACWQYWSSNAQGRTIWAVIAIQMWLDPNWTHEIKSS